MAYGLKKISQAMTMLLIPLMNHLDGAYCDSTVYKECAQEYCQTECCQPECSCDTWFFSADLLYWRAYENGLEGFCDPAELIDTEGTDGRITSVIIQKNEHLHFNWDLGFRLGLGYNFASKGFDAAVYWTHFRDHVHGDNTHWKLNFDIVDLIAGHKFYLGSCFSLKPYAGLRGVWSNQTLHNDSFTTIESIAGISHINFKQHLKERFWGVGPQVGVEADVEIGCGFSLYGSAAAALLYGEFDVKNKRVQELETEINIDFSKHNHCAAQGAIDGALGARWQKSFCNNRLLTLQLGLEHHRYWDFNQLGSSGDLCFDGVVFSARVDY